MLSSEPAHQPRPQACVRSRLRGPASGRENRSLRAKAKVSGPSSGPRALLVEKSKVFLNREVDKNAKQMSGRQGERRRWGPEEGRCDCEKETGGISADENVPPLSSL